MVAGMSYISAEANALPCEGGIDSCLFNFCVLVRLQ